MLHDHDHSDDGHGHAGHSHGVSADADRGKLTIALGLILGFMAFEVAVGIISHSLALLSDAAHMLTDAAAIGLSLVALRLAARPAKGAMTFGLKRTEILSAQFNGATLLVLALLIIYEGITRLVTPPPVAGTAVLVVALIGIVVNLAATYTLSKANRQSMNVEGAFQHILTDLAAFIFTAIAGAVIILTGFHRADGIASLIIAAIMLHAVRENSDCHELAGQLKRLLGNEFDIEHTTLQVDHEHTQRLTIEPAEQVDRSLRHAQAP